MSQRKCTFAEGEFYHIYNRGNSKQIIFKDKADYVRFQQLLYVVNSDKNVTFRLIEKSTMFQYSRGLEQVAIGAYCLMPNHFHLLLTPVVENGIQIFMQKLSTAYSMYFNKRYERTGVLFEGRFKSEHVGYDEYLKYLFSYIHLNPVKLIQSDWKEVGISDSGEATRFLNSYDYSSYLDFERIRQESPVLNLRKFPVYFENKESFQKNIFEWLNYKESLDIDSSRSRPGLERLDTQ